MGHRQVLDFGTRTLVDGSQQVGIIAGACYLHEEGYKGFQGNKHWRGVVVLHDVRNGFGNPMFVDLDYLERKYGEEVDEAEQQAHVNRGTSERGTRSKNLSDPASERTGKALRKTGTKSNPKGAGNRSPKGVPARKKGV